MKVEDVLKSRMDDESYRKLEVLNNSVLDELVARAVLRFQPRSVFVSDGSEKDLYYTRVRALRNGEEAPLLMPGHTVHYDGYEDQGRDPANTKFLTPGGAPLGPGINCMDRDEGLSEIDAIMDSIMSGKEMVVSFYSLGPVGTEFAIPCVQITDSFYVAHSEDILYRQGYELFKDLEGERFFSFLHSAGGLEEGVSRRVDLRRVYIDLENRFVHAANTQYAGNTVAAKKLAHRLAISRAAREGWLAEHLFIGSVPDYEGRTTTYVAGAFPSWCGKTSTSMLFNVVGDDLAHLRKQNGKVMAANVEKGMFGVIKDVNPKDDPYINEILVNSGEIIFSNILDVEGRGYWQGMGKEEKDLPLRGRNHSGLWWKGKKDAKGREIPLSHANARFCVALDKIKNYDPAQVVELEGIIYGGRSGRRPVPVTQSYGWVHGVFYGASIESEPTAATVGSAPKVLINPMANKEFLSIPLGKYLANHIRFGEGLRELPRVFYVNYFLRDEKGNFTNSKMDKKVWVRWMERRIRGRMKAYATPVGYIPVFEDLPELFERELGNDYTLEQYESQFAIRTPQLLEKLGIVEEYYEKQQQVHPVPDEIFQMIRIQKKLLQEVANRWGEVVSPLKFRDYPVPEDLSKPF